MQHNVAPRNIIKGSQISGSGKSYNKGLSHSNTGVNINTSIAVSGHTMDIYSFQHPIPLAPPTFKIPLSPSKVPGEDGNYTLNRLITLATPANG